MTIPTPLDEVFCAVLGYESVHGKPPRAIAFNPEVLDRVTKRLCSVSHLIGVPVVMDASVASWEMR